MSMFIQFNLCTYINYCSVRLPVSTSSHGSYIVTSVISYYSCMQQGVDRHPCLVTIYNMFTDTGQEVLAPTVSTHNRHKLSHQLSVVTASTLYPAPDIVSLYTVSLNRIGGVTVLLDLRMTTSSTRSSIMSFFRVSTTSVTSRPTRNGPVYFGTSDDCTLSACTNTNFDVHRSSGTYARPRRFSCHGFSWNV